MRSTLGAVLLVLASAGVAAGNTIKYTVTDLGAMGGVASIATAINQNGQVVVVAIEYGGSVPSQDYTAQAFVYSNGTTRESGSVDGFTRTMVNGINDSGQVVGYSGPPGFGAEYYSHAFINTNGVVTDLAARCASTPRPLMTAGRLWALSLLEPVTGTLFLISTGR